MDLSYWELKNWFGNIDYTIVGSGIVGLHTALRLRERFPQSRILVLEKGALPQGASTKNAGFACFGSLSEIIDDLNIHSEEEVCSLVKKRREGLQLLRRNLGDAALCLKPYGGYELFLEKDAGMYEHCLQKLPFINDLLRPMFRNDVFAREVDRFGFQGIRQYVIFNPHEAQIDTGNMMQALLKKAYSEDIMVLNGQAVTDFCERRDSVEVSLGNFSFDTRKLLFTTNGFSGPLTANRVKPARAQVLITEPIANLDIRGTFHLDRGYYYFRNIDDRILLGGGRNLDFETETTTEFSLNPGIQSHLDQLLREVILPGTDVRVSHRWSGIMGMGESKQPIVSRMSDHVYCGVRLGGMGIAIGSIIGQELADLI